MRETKSTPYHNTQHRNFADTSTSKPRLSTSELQTSGKKPETSPSELEVSPSELG
jgi:hypothetical protein